MNITVLAMQQHHTYVQHVGESGAAADMADRWMNKSRVDLVNLILFIFP